MVDSEVAADHRRWMQRCLQLAQQPGTSAPNPLVGSVIVRDGQEIAEGFHPGAGQPHAEALALQRAGEQARGATLYVNLEPCNHYGRTPPCSEAIIRAEVQRVVIGMVDPDPRVSGAGIERLRQAGVDVIVGVEESACAQLNEAFVYRVLRGRPFGILKYAMTLDGAIATPSGHSAWVSSPEARQWVHRLRGRCDAVVVGGNTVRRDNPRLTTHGECDRNPLRVVMSRQLDLPTKAHMWDQAAAPTVVFTESAAGRPSPPVETVTVERLTPAAVMAQLHQRGCNTVLWECGGTLAARAIAEQQIQKLFAFIAPKLAGQGYGPVGRLPIERMDQAIALEQTRWETVGPDLLVSGYLSG